MPRPPAAAANPSEPRLGVQLPIYLDNHATTRTDPRVLEAMAPHFVEDYGNAASHGHVFGWRAEAAVEAARESLAAAIGAEARELVFTSGATESNNLAILGVARGRAERGNHLITVATEHRAVLDPCEALVREGDELTVLSVAGDGLLDPAAVADAISEQTVLVSVMLANNEIGVIQPLAEIAEHCRERGVLLHCDAAQALGKLPIDVNELGVDLLSACAHKLYGPKGVGFLYVRARRPRIRLAPILFGGGHERGMRSGTLAVPLVVGFARALELCVAEMESEQERLTGLRERLRTALEKNLDGVHLNGHPEQRLPGNLNLAFDDVDADALLVALKDVAISTGSACTSADPHPSHVLSALGLSERQVRASIRIGIGRFNSVEEIDWVAEKLTAAVRQLREAGPRRNARKLAD